MKYLPLVVFAALIVVVNVRYWAWRLNAPKEEVDQVIHERDW